MLDQALIIEPNNPADSCVIWLHGLGASRRDFEPVAHMLQAQFPCMRFVLPQAPEQPVTINGGMRMPSWYDILSISPAKRAINLEQLEQSSQDLVQVMRAQIQDGIEPQRIFLAGFSQGGAVVLHTAFLRWQQALGGVLALSTYAPTFEDAPPAVMAHPTLCMHGRYDGVVPVVMGQAVQQQLEQWQVPVSWHDYPMQHEVCHEQIADIGHWLHQQLQAADKTGNI